MTCNICRQLVGDQSGDLIARLLGGDYRRRVFLENGTFATIPSIGPLSAGHILLVPVQHICRLIDLDPSQREEFTKYRATVEQCLKPEFGDFVYAFEHGSDSGGTVVPCTVGHAHLHLVPSPVALKPVLPMGRSWQILETTGLDAVARLAGEREYLYWSPSSGPAMVAAADGTPLESQLLRRVLAVALGVDAWNWREEPRLDLLRETEQRLLEGSARHRSKRPALAR